MCKTQTFHYGPCKMSREIRNIYTGSLLTKVFFLKVHLDESLISHQVISHSTLLEKFQFYYSVQNILNVDIIKQHQ